MAFKPSPVKSLLTTQHIDQNNRLYAITDSKLMTCDEIMLAKCRIALTAGCRLLQYRDKSQDTSKRHRQASALKALCQEFSAELIINDDLNLAKELNVGLHLGQGDGSIKDARKKLGAHAIIGSTCHADLSLAKKAIQEGASYIAFGRFFVSSTKPDAAPAPLTLLKQAREVFDLPIVAIGGINGDNSQQIFSAGADYAAACASVFDTEDTAQEVKKFHISQETP